MIDIKQRWAEAHTSEVEMLQDGWLTWRTSLVPHSGRVKHIAKSDFSDGGFSLVELADSWACFDSDDLCIFMTVEKSLPHAVIDAKSHLLRTEDDIPF